MGNVLYAASTGIRPRRYLDDDKSHDRAGVYALFMLLFIGAVIGLSVYQSQNRTSKQVKVDYPKYSQVQDLTNQYYDDEIQNLACDCNKPYENLPEVNATQNTLCEDAVTANVSGVPYIALCNGLDNSVTDLYYRTKISDALLLDFYDFSDAIYGAYLEACGSVIANNLASSQALAIYFEVQNVGDSATFTTECVNGVWQVLLDKAADPESDLCSASDTDSAVETEPDYVSCPDENIAKYEMGNISTYYDDYFCNCAVKQCTYSVKQSDFDVFLILVSYVGTIFGVVIALAALLYGCLFATEYDGAQKKKRRRKRAQAIQEHEMRLEAPLNEEERSEASVQIRDDVAEMEVEEGKVEGAYRSDKCFVTACKERPLNSLSLFCRNHMGISKVDEEPPKDK